MKKKIANPGVITNFDRVFDLVAEVDSCLGRDDDLQEASDQWKAEVQDKDDLISQYLSKRELQRLNRQILVKLLKHLWAQNSVPRSKDNIVDKMIALGLGRIRVGFENLLYSHRPISDRFDSAVSELLGLGAASISEILAHHDKHKYAIWNSRALEGLRMLQVGDKYLPYGNPINGAGYAEYCRTAQELISQISKKYPHYNDLLQLDFILYFAPLCLGDQPGN
jgi:hypothetical protein